MSYADCCAVPGQMPLLRISPIVAPAPPTGYAHPKCYMRGTNDCSTKISGEHYISAAILAEFPKLRTTGLRWLGPGETLVSANALRSNILCRRHNSALSPLDTEGWRMLVAIRAGLVHVSKKSLSRKTLYRIVSGDAFELWGLKTLMGLHEASVAQADGVPTKQSFAIPKEIIIEALTGAPLPKGFGLYVGQDSDLIHDEIGFAPLTHPKDRRVAGLRITFLGIVLDFLVDPSAAAHIVTHDDPHYRPDILDFEGSERTARLILTWEDQRHAAKRLGFKMNWVPKGSKQAEGLKERMEQKRYERRSSSARRDR